MKNGYKIKKEIIKKVSYNIPEIKIMAGIDMSNIDRNINVVSFRRYVSRNLKGYIFNKYGINKYDYSNVKIGQKPPINTEWRKIIDNYLLKRKLRVKLPEKGIVEKRKKI